MKVKRTLKMIVGCLLITNLCWAGITQEGDTLPPGVVIHNAPAISHEYIYAQACQTPEANKNAKTNPYTDT